MISTKACPELGADVASWTFDRLPAGMYRVAATWSAYSNRASNAPFSILDDSLLLGTVLVDQRVAPSEFSDANAAWNWLGGAYRIDSGTLTVQLADDADGRLNADAIRIERMEATPEIQVFQQAAEILDNVGVVEFGQAQLAQPVSMTFSVVNAGGATLTLDTPISVPNGYQVESSFDDVSLEPGETTHFSVRLTADSVGAVCRRSVVRDERRR